MVRSPRHRRFVFTLNNPTDEEKTVVAALCNSDDVTYGIVGREQGESGTPHLQGFVIFARDITLPSAKTQISARAHLEPARGSSKQASDYCKKDGDFDEYGECPITGTTGGRSSDLTECIDWINAFIASEERAPTAREICIAHTNAYIRYPRVIEAATLLAPPILIRDGTPNEWQEELLTMLEGEADDRTIQFYCDTEGGKGKTWFQQYYYSKYPEKCQLLSIGKRDDLAYTIDTTKSVFLFNIPRECMQFLQYSLLEQLKDRTVFSPKYQSVIKIFRHNNHVIVFANEEPDPAKLSADRVDLIHL